ncbi:MAG: GAF domain-containing protein [Acidobacteria bacterium]|nr:GAF domain-containing protein [Acidobacteriota bacterium]
MSTLPHTDIDEPLSSDMSWIAEQAVMSTGATGAAILALDDSSDCICRAAVGVMVDGIGARVDQQSGITGCCLQSREIVCCEDTQADTRVNAEACRQLDIRSAIAVPLFNQGRIVGALEAFSNLPNAFGTVQNAALRNLADVTGRVITGDIAGERAISAAVEQNAARQCAHLSLVELKSTGSNAALQFGPPTPRRRWQKTAVITIASLSLLGLGSLFWRDRWPDFVAASAPAEASPVTSAVADLSSLPLSSLPLVPADLMVQVATGPADGWMERLQSAADRGDAEAQFRLADAFATGEGVPIDRVKAYMWYIAAGMSGNPRSKEAIRLLTPTLTRAELARVRFSMGRMFRNGVGMPRDYVSAYCWFVLADVAGEPRARSEIAELSRSMSPRSMQEARNRASAWLTRHGEPGVTNSF